MPLAEPILCGNLLDFAQALAPQASRSATARSLRAMPSVKELRAAAAALGLETTGMEKHELEAAVAAAEAAEEEKLLAEALAMSEESAETLASLGIAELRRRCEARGIETRGLAEKADLVAALLGTAMADEAAAPVDAATSPAAAAPTSTIGRFVRPFVLYEARTASRADALDETGKVVLPAQQLTALAMATGGELPPTLLLRISHAEASVHVGVAEFADDAPLAAALPPEARRHWPFVVVVPRWVRLALQCAEGGAANLTIAQLPAATSLHLQPHEEGVAAAVGAAGDPRGLLTELMNRFVAVSRGDVLSLHVGGRRFAVDVLRCAGRQTKCAGGRRRRPARSTWARRWRRRRPTAPMHRSPPLALWIAT